MLYFTKAELAETYHISEKTVTNWIKEAKSGKLDLELYKGHGGARIAKTTRNITLIEELVQKRKKFRNTRGSKVVLPKPEFYELYTPQQILYMSSNLDIRREIPFQYGYFDGGAEYWNKYALRLASEKVPNNLTNTRNQLQNNLNYIDALLKHYNYVNVIDIGPGNCLPVKDLLQHLVDTKKLGRYTAIDISDSMLKIAQRNIEKWFDSKVPFVGHLADISYARFTELAASDVIGPDASETINLVLAVGGTFANLHTPDNALRVIRDSLNQKDLFIYDRKLDNESARSYFDFSVDDKVAAIDIKSKMVLDLLNIDESFYDVEMGFNEADKERFIRIRLKVALTIKFAFEEGKRIVEFNKNDDILLWRSWHQNVQDVLQQLNRTEFSVLQTSLTEDEKYVLTISRVKSKR